MTDPYAEKDISLSRLWRLDPTRLFALDLRLAATGIFLWFFLHSLSVQIACSRSALRLTIEYVQWQAQWPWGPWIAVVASLALTHLRHRSAPTHEQRTSLHRRLQQLVRLTGVLLIVRLLSLWDPFLALFPYLTMLWAPHTTWALCLLFPLFLLAPLAERPRRLWHIALLLFTGATVLYTSYTLYFCQLTMLHGDEGQYLRVTQSLLHDGDIDLANNTSEEQILEFHVGDFDLHKAPFSPPGKAYSVHPAGLSVLTVPAYWFGLARWQNPRLGSALFMVLLAAACVATTFIWLVRLGLSRFTACLGAAIMALTTPFFFYSNQIYPEIPALFITLIVLATLSHWQVSGGSYRGFGRCEPAVLAALEILLALLPFLHPRYLPIVLVANAAIFLQAWHSPRRWLALGAAGGTAALGLIALGTFNYTLSGDWTGHFRPGNAWPENALSIAALAHSLPGQWLERGDGLLNNSPVFLLVLVGWALLARERDRRLLVAGGLFGATALVNGLNNLDWTMGYCMPVRFFIVALPALLIGLARGLAMLSKSAAGSFFALVGLAISIDGILTILPHPELAYLGGHLPLRTINHFYPLDIHFPYDPTSAPDFPDLLFWLGAALLLILAVSPARHRLLRPAALAAIALMPFLWGQIDLIADRLKNNYSPYLGWLEDDGHILDLQNLEIAFTNRFRQTTGGQLPNGHSFARAPEHGPGSLAVHHIPINLVPGWYRLEFPDLNFDHPPGLIAGHLVVSQLLTLPAVSPWSRNISSPISDETRNRPQLPIFLVDWTSIGHVYVEFSGNGSLSQKQCTLRLSPRKVDVESELLHQFDIADPPRGEGPLALTVAKYGLDPGHYRVQFDFVGDTFAMLFERNLDPISTAVYISSPLVRDRDQMRALTKSWMLQKSEPDLPIYLRPQTESHQPPWWLNMPLVGDAAYDLRFSLDTPQDVWCNVHYPDSRDLKVNKISIYRELFDEADLP